jgi:shikimate kinase
MGAGGLRLPRVVYTGRVGGQKTLWLVGMMGAGKTAVGRALAARLELPFVDSDAEVVARSGRSIPETFAQAGEGGFRSLEREAIEGLAGRELVVSLGGGAIAQPGMADFLAAAGIVVYLRARPETLLGRLGDCADRPLLAGLEPAERAGRLVSLLDERRAAYESAAIIVDTDGIPAEEVAAAVAEKLAVG